MNTAELLNVHPADELAELRQEQKQLEEREAKLKAVLLELPPGERHGKFASVNIHQQTRETLDRKQLEAELGKDRLKKYLRETTYSVFKVTPRISPPQES